ncbi:DUF1445 domain-containing protein [Diaporthe amygdali]|uniref:DUF1445 domain-containing protein n=1 Tax=Phomopsis amygdali TaxID=1214568 RepID=UPI0022FE87FB|nr:DUF1445 domain-containing protein [Diaporthe amygdali]KAJ0110297.1 DUF1445 domain-containing protein [Diaporthe amygdali]
MALTSIADQPTAPLGATLKNGRDVRLAARASLWLTPTSGLAPGYLQANLLVLPSRYAADFRLLCQRNPVPCPLVAESSESGSFSSFKSYLPGLSDSAVLNDIDIRLDIPYYNVYADSTLVKSACPDIASEWTADHVAFLIGCSFSFEGALTGAGLTPPHTALNRNVPMYRTTIPLCPAGVFTNGIYVVSMRSYKLQDIEKVREITSAYVSTHGEPIAWGWQAVAKLGIKDIDAPDFGDAPLTRYGKPLGDEAGSEDEVPVFWGCGVTPQEAIKTAGLSGIIMAHAPGHMLLLDCQDSDVFRRVQT